MQVDTVGAVCSLPGIDHQRVMFERISIDAQMDQMSDKRKFRPQERSRVSSLNQSVSCSPTGKSRGESVSPPSSSDDNQMFYKSDSVAGGVPILELVRMLEDEMHISRDDKLALNTALLDSERRDIVIITLRDIELSSNIRFAVRRLKMLIHQNPAGMPAEVRSSFSPTLNQGQRLSITTSNLVTPQSSNSPATNNCSPSTARLSETYRNQGFKLGTFSPMCTDTKGNTAQSLRSPETRRGSISKKRQGSYIEPVEGIWSEGPSPRIALDAMVATSTLVSDSPVYSDPNRSSMCSKISRRLSEYNGEEGNAQKKMRPAKFAVLVGSGSCNPLTRMHMRSFFLAKQHLERIVGFVVLGSILSPSHGVSVRERYRNHPGEVIPSPHRLAVAQLMVAGSKWLSVDSWEITRRRTMDYLSLLQHCRAILSEEFPAEEIKIIYLCKENMVPKISPSALRQENFGCISVCRPIECERIKSTLTSKWNGTLWVAEDTAMLDTSMDIVTSRDVRQKLKENQPVRHLVGGLIDEYFKKHLIGAKMKGDSEWVPNELRLPPILSRPNRHPRGSQIDLLSANMTHTGSSPQLLLDHSDIDTGVGGKSPSVSTSILQPTKIDQDAVSLSFLPHSPPGSPHNALQPPIDKHMQSGTSTHAVISTGKPRAKVKYRRIVKTMSRASRQDEA